MGLLRVLKSPNGAAREMPGPLNLPPTFDRSKYVSKWCKEGQEVAAAQERQYIPGTDLTADGWEVWRDGNDKPLRVPLAKGNYILMFRSKAVQDAVNATCGNIGKQRVLQEKRGETIAGETPSDPGMLTNDRLAKVIGKDSEAEEDGDVKLNPEVVEEEEDRRITKPKVKTVASRTRRPKAEA